jgi:hypothetical protein
MVNPKYATVKHYATVGEHIVQAIQVPEEFNAALTGLLVEVLPVMYLVDKKGNKRETDTWEMLDALEGGYDRIKIKTTDKDEAWMYVAKLNYDGDNKNGQSTKRTTSSRKA